MQIIDFSHLETTSNKKQGYWTLEAATAALFFIVPALLLFVLSAR